MPGISPSDSPRTSLDGCLRRKAKMRHSAKCRISPRAVPRDSRQRMTWRWSRSARRWRKRGRNWPRARSGGTARCLGLWLESGRRQIALPSPGVSLGGREVRTPARKFQTSHSGQTNPSSRARRRRVCQPIGSLASLAVSSEQSRSSEIRVPAQNQPPRPRRMQSGRSRYSSTRLCHSVNSRFSVQM